MQIFDRKYRLFGIINPIDLLVVVALIVAGLVAWKLLWGGSDSAVPAAKLQSIEYTLWCASLRNYSDGQIKVGDPVSTKVSGKTIGTVASVRSIPTPIDAINPTSGKIQLYASSLAKDVYITVRAQGEPTPTGVSVANTQVRNNAVIPMVTPTFQCETAIATDLKIGGE